MVMIRIGWFTLLAACSAPSERRSATPDTGLSSVASPEPLNHQFSFAIIADPHIVGAGEHEARLKKAVEWIEANAVELDLQLVMILGDICWGNGFNIAHAALDKLTLPWVPVMGDNVIQTGGESTFHSTFQEQIERLATDVEGFTMADTPVANPERGGESWLQNMAFRYGDVQFIAADWSSREVHPLWGETPDLHDFEGGTWPWLTQQLALASTAKSNNTILLSHMPLFEGPGGLTVDEADAVVTLLSAHQDALWANLAGHLHVDSSMDWDRAGIEVHVTDATWDDVNRVRVVDVSSSETQVSYDHWIVDVL